MKGLVGGAAQVQQIVGETGLQPCFHGVRTLALTPPMQSVPRRRGVLGVVEGTKAARSGGSKAAASRGSRTSNWRLRWSPTDEANVSRT